MKSFSVLLVLAVPVLLVAVSHALSPLTAAQDPPAPKCSMGLSSDGLATHCAEGQNFTCNSQPCCHHEHQAITWNNLIDTGTCTHKKSGGFDKKYYEYYIQTCEDHDQNPSTPDTCGYPTPGASQDGPDNNPTHFVKDWTLEDIDCGH